MASFLLEALKGVKAEMHAAGTLQAQIQRLPKVLSILAAEIASLLSLIPYAVSTMHLYRYVTLFLNPQILMAETGTVFIDQPSNE